MPLLSRLFDHSSSPERTANPLLMHLRFALAELGRFDRLEFVERTVDYTGEWYVKSSVELTEEPPSEDELFALTWQFVVQSVLATNSKSCKLVITTGGQQQEIFPLPLANIRQVYGS